MGLSVDRSRTPEFVLSLTLSSIKPVFNPSTQGLYFDKQAFIRDIYDLQLAYFTRMIPRSSFDMVAAEMQCVSRMLHML